MWKKVLRVLQKETGILLTQIRAEQKWKQKKEKYLSYFVLYDQDYFRPEKLSFFYQWFNCLLGNDEPKVETHKQHQRQSPLLLSAQMRKLCFPVTTTWHLATVQTQ